MTSMKRIGKLARHQTRERGVVLIMCLIFLVIMTLIGSSGLRSTLLEEKMAGHMREQDIAFQEAEAALRFAEAWLWQLDGPPGTCDGNNCGFGYGSDSQVWAEDRFFTEDIVKGFDDGWWADSDNALPFPRGVAAADAKTFFFIQFVNAVPNSPGSGGQKSQDVNYATEDSKRRYYFYRVFAKSRGPSDTAEVVLETSFTTSFRS